jgi:hypothetical protein
MATGVGAGSTASMAKTDRSEAFTPDWADMLVGYSSAVTEVEPAARHRGILEPSGRLHRRSEVIDPIWLLDRWVDALGANGDPVLLDIHRN